MAAPQRPRASTSVVIYFGGGRGGLDQLAELGGAAQADDGLAVEVQRRRRVDAPAPRPAAVSARTAACCSPVARQASQAATSRPADVAIARSRASANAPWFSPDWLAKAQSWNGQNPFWSAAQRAPAAASTDSS